MSNIRVRENGGGGQLVNRGEWEPLRRIGELLRWDPFREMMPSAGSPFPDAMFSPAFEVLETKAAYIFKADLPGVKEEDVEITHAGRRLTIAGSRSMDKEEKADAYYAYERTYGDFTRSFNLPDGVDAEHIRAELKEGVLTVFVPKTAEAQPRKIGLKGLFGKG
jgi:HSP20 family protein